jgi:Fur family ferric uptake transcriptional regulator
MRGAGDQRSLTTAALETALRAVRHDGGRVTTTRRIVLESLARLGEAGVTAEEMTAHIRLDHPTFNTSTIYRCLERFEELGIATHAHLGHGPALWRLADRVRWYVVCTGCGASVDVDSRLIDHLRRHLMDSTGFTLNGHFALSGLCEPCSGSRRHSSDN